jgi:hypothetical protein
MRLFLSMFGYCQCQNILCNALGPAVCLGNFFEGVLKTKVSFHCLNESLPSGSQEDCKFHMLDCQFPGPNYALRLSDCGRDVSQILG